MRHAYRLVWEWSILKDGDRRRRQCGTPELPAPARTATRRRMAELILHQYAMSPFSEKVRKVFAVKSLAWRAVDQPMWNPKPQLVPLTGGYRRIPVLQIGADVYCDTARIIREIEARHPAPTVFPADMRGVADVVAWFADQQLFRV